MIIQYTVNNYMKKNQNKIQKIQEFIKQEIYVDI